MTQLYYFETEKPSTKSPLVFAYIWRAGDDNTTTAPVKEFHSLRGGEEAFRRVTEKAIKWIKKNGALV